MRSKILLSHNYKYTLRKLRLLFTQKNGQSTQIRIARNYCITVCIIFLRVFFALKKKMFGGILLHWDYKIALYNQTKLSFPFNRVKEEWADFVIAACCRCLRSCLIKATSTKQLCVLTREYLMHKIYVIRPNIAESYMHSYGILWSQICVVTVFNL